MTAVRIRINSRSVASWLLTVLTASLLTAWFVTLAPLSMGGPATYVIVNGVSMEPLLHTGDLVVARHESTYALGDLVVIHIAEDQGINGSVIHRLVAGNPQTGWKTKGDNNSWVDPWTVLPEQIAGRFWGEAPGFGSYLTWVNHNALAFAVVCTGIVLLSYLPWRRKKSCSTLRAAIDSASKEPRRNGGAPQEYGVLLLSGLAALAAIALVGLLGMSHRLVSIQGFGAALALAWAGGFTVYFAYRLFDGVGVPEPSKSLYALSGRLYLVEELPELDTPVQPVASAIALRTIAERYRMPVLHRVDPDSGAHEFLLITVQKGAFLWTVLPAPASHEPTTAPSAAPAVLQPAFAAACVAESLSSLGELLAPVPILATVEPVLEPAVDVDQPDIAPEKGDRRRAVRRTRWRERRRRTAHDRHHHDV